MTDEEIIEAAQALYASDEVLIQEPGLGTPEYGIEQIVDRVDDGAWVMAWVWLPNVKEAS